MQQQTLAKLLADKERRSDTELKMKEEMEKLAEEKKSREKEERDIMQVEREKERERDMGGGGGGSSGRVGWCCPRFTRGFSGTLCKT